MGSILSTSLPISFTLGQSFRAFGSFERKKRAWIRSFGLEAWKSSIIDFLVGRLQIHEKVSSSVILSSSLGILLDLKFVFIFGVFQGLSYGFEEFLGRALFVELKPLCLEARVGFGN